MGGRIRPRSSLGGGTCSTPLMAWSGGTSPGRAGAGVAEFQSLFMR